jgi:hypothetical protein
MTRKEFQRTYGKRPGAILYRGPSRIDGSPIVAIVTGFGKPSANAKTGKLMLQTFIIRADLSPVDAIRGGADYGICGTCEHRGHVGRGDIAPLPQSVLNLRTCYVDIGKSVRSVYETFLRDRYVDVSGNLEAVEAIGADMQARLGAYGDPAAVPLEVWQAFVRRTIRHTGYTHQWRRVDLADATSLCMASADSVEDYRDATAAGYRTFRVRTAEESLLSGEIACPAAEESGKRTTCDHCGLCKGAGSKAKNIAIIVHGAGRKNFRRDNLPTLQGA